jgi:hypothetical protein
MRALICLAFILVYTPLISEAGCPTFFERVKSVFFKPSLKITLSESVKNDLFHFRFNEFPKSKKVTFSNSRSNEFGFLLTKLPKSFIEVLVSTPKDSRHLLELKDKVFRINRKMKDSIFENIFDALRFETIGKEEGTFESVIQKRLSEFEKLSSSKKSRIEESYSYGLLVSKASRHWESNFFNDIPVISQHGNKITFKIGDKIFEGKIVERRGGKFVVFLASKDLFSHPAWNPLDHRYIAKLASDPTFRGKDFYPVSVGLNGRLYLLDGNHRSTVDPRGKLPAEIPYPMKTSNIRNYLDLIGKPQPTTVQKIQILKGELDPNTLLQ